MNLTLLVHPTIAAGAVVAVLAAYLLKTRKKLYFRLHYAAGVLAFALSMLAFPVGLYLVFINGGVSVFPPALTFHTVSFFAAIGLIVIQGALGMGMLLFGRKRDVYRTHKRMAKYVLVVFLLQGALGLLTLYGVLPFVFGP
jgi:heme A synthase